MGPCLLDAGKGLIRFTLVRSDWYIPRRCRREEGSRDHPSQGTQLGLGGTLVQQVNVDVLWEGELALVDGLEKSGLSATVLTQQTVSSAVVDLEGGVVEEDFSVEDERCRDDLDIARLLERGKHTSSDTVG